MALGFFQVARQNTEHPTIPQLTLGTSPRHQHHRSCTPLRRNVQIQCCQKRDKSIRTLSARTDESSWETGWFPARGQGPLTEARALCGGGLGRQGPLSERVCDGTLSGGHLPPCSRTQRWAVPTRYAPERFRALPVRRNVQIECSPKRDRSIRTLSARTDESSRETGWFPARSQGRMPGPRKEV